MVRIHVSNDSSGRIVTSSPYGPFLVARAKTINSHRWHPAEKHWSFPNTESMLEKILRVFGDEEVKDTPSPLGPEGTVLDLRTERNGVVESRLSPKFDFEDLRKELV